MKGVYPSDPILIGVHLHDVWGRVCAQNALLQVRPNPQLYEFCPLSIQARTLVISVQLTQYSSDLASIPDAPPAGEEFSVVEAFTVRHDPLFRYIVIIYWLETEEISLKTV